MDEITRVNSEIEYLKEFKTDNEFLKVVATHRGESIITFIPKETIDHLSKNPKIVSFEIDEEE